MSAIPENFLGKTAKINDASIQPFPNSKKIYISGSRADIKVPMREVTLNPTPIQNPDGTPGFEQNQPVLVYDTSGPYTDPQVCIDIRNGLSEVRAAWIEERGDTEVLHEQSSQFGRERAVPINRRESRRWIGRLRR